MQRDSWLCQPCLRRGRVTPATECDHVVPKAQYADPENEHVVTDLPVLDSATYIAADNGEPLVLDMGELPGETGVARGQRLMKLALLKGRRQKQVTLPCSLAAWPVRLGDTIRVSLPRRGWTAKTFEVTGRTVHIGEDGVRVTLSCIETGPAIFDWRTSEEMPKPAGGVPTLPSPTAKPVVSAPTMTEELYETRGGGGVKTRVRLAATTDNPFIDAWQFACAVPPGAMPGGSRASRKRRVNLTLI
ncbi:hypothetical protein A6024_03660 [Rhodovulum sulfidophilum]|nr:hypothetical protein A6W98_03675 [Rhodovulum sulfidophilum DSM 1374]ANB37105.1 hypothetical protein A6024_03660 [Rhodovulum sulfidophilum]